MALELEQFLFISGRRQSLLLGLRESERIDHFLFLLKSFSLLKFAQYKKRNLLVIP